MRDFGNQYKHGTSATKLDFHQFQLQFFSRHSERNKTLLLSVRRTFRHKLAQRHGGDDDFALE